MKFLTKLLAVTALVIPGMVNASVIFNGDYIGVTINDAGSLASLKHDPTGNATYGVNDYITPGIPHDGFSVTSTETGFLQNRNTGTVNIIGGPSSVLAGAAALGYDFAATWAGATSFLSVNNSYFYNLGDERIRVISTITALSDLTSLAFARSVDPDPDVNTSGSFDTNNQRGNALFGATDFIGAAGPVTGLTLALVNNSGNTYTHNTLIGTSCCVNVDPNTVLSGGIFSNTDDSSLNMAWLVGSLSTGNSATIEYFYAVGDRIDVVGDPGAVPEPATWLMMIMGFGLVGAAMRRKQPSTLRVRYN